jgi:hypothetical protein
MSFSPSREWRNKRQRWTKIKRDLAVREPAAAPLILQTEMLFFFSNRIGCLGSLLFSVAATLLLLWLTGFIQVPAGW